MGVTHEGQSGKEQSELITHPKKKNKKKEEEKKNSKQLQRSLCSGRREEEKKEKGVWVLTAPLKSVRRVQTEGGGQDTSIRFFFCRSTETLTRSAALLSLFFFFFFKPVAGAFSLFQLRQADTGIFR